MSAADRTGAAACGGDYDPAAPFLQSNRGGLPAVPLNIKVEFAKTESLLEYAIKVKDWPLIEDSIDKKIEEQCDFVGEWDQVVGVRESPGRGGIKSSTELDSISMQQAERDTGISHVQVSRWRKQLKDPAKYLAQQLLAVYRKAGLEPLANHRAEGTGENEWFTPQRYSEAARSVMGAIDLDPATHPIAQQTVRAISHYTAAENGLAQEWHGRVWLNPPLSCSTINPAFIRIVRTNSVEDLEIALTEYRAGISLSTCGPTRARALVRL